MQISAEQMWYKSTRCLSHGRQGRATVNSLENAQAKKKEEFSRYLYTDRHEEILILISDIFAFVFLTLSMLSFFYYS